MNMPEAYGPVPSRRLGRSLGVNHVPPKTCSYSCVYCQLGRTNRMTTRRQVFFSPDAVVEAVASRVNAVRALGERIDYLALVPDGEPTLDINLGEIIRSLRQFGIPVAVITNCSLIDQLHVRNQLADADWVSLKVDSVDEAVWRRVDRPHASTRLRAMLDGMMRFAAQFDGTLVTETMLVGGVNDGEADIQAVAAFVAGLRPKVAYLTIPTRPPAEMAVSSPSIASLARAYAIMAANVARVECLTGYEGNEFAASGDFDRDVLSTTAVHPMREEAVEALIKRTGASWRRVEELIAADKLVKSEYNGTTYYARQLRPAEFR